MAGGARARPRRGTHAEPERWHVVNVFNADAVPMPLTFDTLEQALDHVRPTPGTLRIMEVTDDGERVPVERERAVRHVAQAPSHYEVEPRQPDPTAGPSRRGGRSGASGRTGPWRRSGGSLQAAQAHAGRLRPRRRGSWRWSASGWRRAVDAAET